MGVELGSAHGRIEIDVSSIRSGVGEAVGTLDQLERKFGAVGTAAKLSIAGTVVDAFKSIGGFAVGIGREALGAVAKQERLEQSLTSLIAKELVLQSTVKKRIFTGNRTIAATQEQIVVNGKQKKSVEDVKFAIEGQDLALRRAQKTYDTLVAKQNGSIKQKNGKNFNVDQLQVESAGHALEAARRAAAKGGDDLKVIPAQGARVVATYKTITETTLDMAKAKQLASVKAKELDGWMERLAIQSPFNKDDVAQAFRLQLAYGFTTKEAQRLTQATIDFAAGSGATGETMTRVALALGQIKAKGKLAGGEMLQLTEAGLNVREALLRAGTIAGLTAENFDAMQRKGLIPADKAIEALIGTLEKDFPNAAKDQASTFSGLIASMEDLKSVAERDFFTPIFKAAQPYLDKFVTALQDPGVRANIQAVGKTIGDVATRGFSLFATIGSTVARFYRLIGLGVRPFQAFKYAVGDLVPPKAQAAFGYIVGTLDKIYGAIQTNNIGAYRDALAGIVPEGVATLFEPLFKAVGDVKDFFAGKISLNVALADVGQRIAAFITNLKNAAVLPDTIDKVLNAFLPWATAALGWLDVGIDTFGPPLEALASTLGDAAGRKVGLVIKVLDSWARELAGFPARADETEIEKGLVGFLEKLRAVALKLVGRVSDIGSALGSGFLNGILDTFGVSKEAQTGIADSARIIGRTFYGALDPKDFAQIQNAKTGANQVGVSLIEGINEGLKQKIEGTELVKGINAMIEGIKTDFGIHSPSTRTAAEIGVPLGDGVVEGILSTLARISAAFSTVLNGAIKSVKESGILSSGGGQASAFGDGLIAPILAAIATDGNKTRIGSVIFNTLDAGLARVLSYFGNGAENGSAKQIGASLMKAITDAIESATGSGTQLGIGKGITGIGTQIYIDLANSINSPANQIGLGAAIKLMIEGGVGNAVATAGAQAAGGGPLATLGGSISQAIVTAIGLSLSSPESASVIGSGLYGLIANGVLIAQPLLVGDKGAAAGGAATGVSALGQAITTAIGLSVSSETAKSVVGAGLYGMVVGSIDKVRGFLRLANPATSVPAAEVGAPIGEGIAVGMRPGIATAESILQRLIDKINETQNSGLIMATVMTNVGDSFVTTIGPKFDKMRLEVLDPLNESLKRIRDTLGGIIEKFDIFATKAQNFKPADVITPGSPTPFEIGLRGIHDAMIQLASASMPNFEDIAFKSIQALHAAQYAGQAPGPGAAIINGQNPYGEAAQALAAVPVQLMMDSEVIADLLISHGGAVPAARSSRRRSYKGK